MALQRLVSPPSPWLGSGKQSKRSGSTQLCEAFLSNRLTACLFIKVEVLEPLNQKNQQCLLNIQIPGPHPGCTELESLESGAQELMFFKQIPD